VVTFALYRQAQLNAWSGDISWASDNIVATLHGTGYTPNLDVHAHVSDLSSELVTGGGYTQGGQLLAGKASSYLPAGSWPDTWQPLTSYQLGQVVRPALSPSLLFRCYIPGTSGPVTPSWPVITGGDVTDGSAAWTAVGAGAVILTASQLQWSGFTSTFRYLVLSDRTPGSAAQQPLIALMDMGGPVTGSGGALPVIPDAGSGTGIFLIFWAP
jgi:hypothetical protein